MMMNFPAMVATCLLALGTAAAQAPARLVRDVNRGPGTFSAAIDWVQPVSRGVVFSMDTLASGQELWVSDGTPAGTRLLKDILPGPGGSRPEQPVPWAGKVAFTLDPGMSTNQLWVTDGTETGTVKIHMIADPEAGELAPLLGTTEGLFFQTWSWDAEHPVNYWFFDSTSSAARCLNPLKTDGSGRENFHSPHSLIWHGEWSYFVANDTEIWRSDGTVEGTTKITSVLGSGLHGIAIAGDHLFAVSSIGFEQVELWSCSIAGESLTLLAKADSSLWSGIEQMISIGNRLFFVPFNQAYQGRIWQSDGTPEGTREIPLDPVGERSVALSSLAAWNDRIYFIVDREGGGKELWRTDGTVVETIMLKDLGSGSSGRPFHLQVAGDHLYFQKEGRDGSWELWRTDGTGKGTRRVMDPGDLNTTYSSGPLVAASGGDLFFAAGRDTPGNALWRTRAVRGGVRLTRPEKASGSALTGGSSTGFPYEMLGGDLLAFVNPGTGPEMWRMKPDGSRARAIWQPEVPLQSYSTLSFEAKIRTVTVFNFSNGGEVRQVWATDGTARGTRLLGDHGAATDDGYPYDFIQAGGTWFYSVVYGPDPSKASLWKTDGTPEGTARIIAADGSMPAPNAGEMVSFQGRLHFLATGVDGKTALWRSDGTTSGTEPIKETWYGQSNEKPMNLAVVGDRLWFSVNLPYAQNIWTSDGTAEGTAGVPSGSFMRWSGAPAVDLGGVAVFQAMRSSPRIQWWRGDDSGVRPVMNGVDWQHLYPWGPDSRNFAVAGSLLFYTGMDRSYDSELWVTDGTHDGSRMVNGSSSELGSTGEMLAVGGHVYFTAHDPAHGGELWRSDGTNPGTVLVADVEPGPASSWPQDLKVMNGKIYFHAERRDIGREMWVVDLPPAP